MSNVIESGQAVRQLGAELLAIDRASLDARCEDSRCGANCGHCAPAARNCSCFPGMCRGGDVVNGRLSNGDRCKACMPALLPESDDTEGGDAS